MVDILDNASNPSQAVQNVQRFVGDSKYVAILGSGNAARRSRRRRSRRRGASRSSRSRLRRRSSLPPPAVRLRRAADLAAVRVQHGAVPKSLGITRIALIGDNGGFGRDGVGQVKALARAFGFTITDDVIFAPTSTSFAAELARVRNSNAQALWMWTVTPPGNTIVKEFRQLQLPQRLVLTGGNLSPQFLEGTCPDVNGALVNSFLGVVWNQLPQGHPIRRGRSSSSV